MFRPVRQVVAPGQSLLSLIVSCFYCHTHIRVVADKVNCFWMLRLAMILRFYYVWYTIGPVLFIMPKQQWNTHNKITQKKAYVLFVEITPSRSKVCFVMPLKESVTLFSTTTTFVLWSNKQKYGYDDWSARVSISRHWLYHSTLRFDALNFH